MSNLYDKTWHVLDIDVSSAIKSEFDFNYLFEQTEGAKTLKELGWCQWYYGDGQLNDLFNQHWLDYMKSIDLEIQHAYVFFRIKRMKEYEAHVDTQSDNNLSIAMNWVIGYDPAEMIWFKKPEGDPDFEYLSPTGKTYYTWDSKKLEEIDRHTVGNKFTAVRVDIPHDILIADVPRLCIAVRTKKKFIDWNSAVDHLTRWIRS